MPRSTWTTAGILASGAAAGALMTYLVMKERDSKSQKTDDKLRRRRRRRSSNNARPATSWKKNCFFQFRSSSSDSIEAEAEDHLNHQTSDHETLKHHHDEQWHLPQQSAVPMQPQQHPYPTNRLQEAMEKRNRLPSLIILVRHGESEGNADHTLYRTKPDNLVELTEKGLGQAKEAGRRIEDIFVSFDLEQERLQLREEAKQLPRRQAWRRQSSVLSTSESENDDPNLDEGDEDDDPNNMSMTSLSSLASIRPFIKRVHLVTSPFERTLQTAAAMRTEFQHRIVRTDVQARIREQEFGNLQGDDFQKFRDEQTRVGRFWYRFPTGESGSDVSDRVQSWWFDSVLNVNERYGYAPIDAMVVVTHGLTMRFVLMQLYGWSPTTFHSVWNADNCDIYVLRKDLSKPGLSPYVLDETHGGNMPKSSIDLLVEFHNELEDGDGDETKPQPNQKKFKLTDYLSIPPPRTMQLELVKKKLVEQYQDEIDSVDSIKSIMFMPFYDGGLAQGRSTSGNLLPEDAEAGKGKRSSIGDKVDERAWNTEEPIILQGPSTPAKSKRRTRRQYNGKGSSGSSSHRFPYYPEVQDDSWRPKQNGESVIAERNFK